MPRRENISKDLREAIIAVHQSEKGYKTKPFEVHHSTVRRVIHMWKTFKKVRKSSQEWSSQ